jgi:hypothetical protein
MHTAKLLIKKYRLLTLIVLALLLQAEAVRAQTSTFTYQGRFTDGGTAANGTYDMQFKLFDEAGNQIGSTITNGAVTVLSGVFTVQLDYGAASFPNANRFLELAVRLRGSGGGGAVAGYAQRPRRSRRREVRPHQRRPGQRCEGTTGTNQTTAEPDQQSEAAGLSSSPTGGSLQIELPRTLHKKSFSQSALADELIIAQQFTAGIRRKG